MYHEKGEFLRPNQTAPSALSTVFGHFVAISGRPRL
jgi:hypothetical protein